MSGNNSFLKIVLLIIKIHRFIVSCRKAEEGEYEVPAVRC